MKKNIYNFKVDFISGESSFLSKFEGKVILLVNVASKCGYTPQYEGLEKLYKTYKDQGLVIVGFPCDQFAHQESGNEEIQSFCSLNYGVTFPLSKKIKVNGKDADPLFIFLKKALTGLITNTVKWNFTKFLIARDGTPVKRFAPKVDPQKITKDIEKLLST